MTEPEEEEIQVKKGGVIASLASIAKGIEGIKRAAEKVARWWKGGIFSLFFIFGADRFVNHQRIWSFMWRPTVETSAKIVQDSVSHVAGGARFRAHIDSGFADIRVTIKSGDSLTATRIDRLQKAVDLLASHTGNKERIRRELNGGESLFGYQK